MPIDFFNRIKNAWNAFTNNKDPTKDKRYNDDSYGYSYRPDRPRFSRGSERSIVNAVYNRIAMDVAAVSIRHVRLDDSDRYLETIDSDLNECFATEANIDQTGRAIIQDIVMSMFDEGCVAVIPVDTDTNPDDSGSIKIYTIRTGKIVEWKANSVRVRAYNDRKGIQEEHWFLKNNVLIIENPFYAVVNEPNSTMQRLIRKLSLLDAVDEQSSAGKLDLIIQLPYTVRSELRKQQADERKKAIEQQLAGSKYGIAYIDSTEHITQLNRAVENNLMSQIEYLTNMVYSQLGITAEILNGTADEKTMLNYNKRTIEPILSAIVDEARRKWLTKTARSQRQDIMFFDQPLRLVPASELADMADKFTRNEIMTSNEFRQILGMKKSDDPNADQLRNKNLNQSPAEMGMASMEAPMEDEETLAMEEMNSDFDETSGELDSIDMDLEELEQMLRAEAKQSDLEGEIVGLFEAEDFDDWLEHYASPYYDPIKAHEYYMKHRKLVGRHSTSGLNDAGKEIAAYIKKNLDEERSEKINQNKSSMNSSISSSKDKMASRVSSLNESKSNELRLSKDQMNSRLSRFKKVTDGIRKSHVSNMKIRISALRGMIKNKTMTPQQKESVLEKIEKLRTENDEKKVELTEKYRNMKTSEEKDYHDESSKLKSDIKKQTDDIRSIHRNLSSKLRSENKEKTSSLKEEYDEKYSEELEKLKSSGQYDKKNKSESKSKSKSPLYKYKNHQKSNE